MYSIYVMKIKVGIIFLLSFSSIIAYGQSSAAQREIDADAAYQQKNQTTFKLNLSQASEHVTGKVKDEFIGFHEKLLTLTFDENRKQLDLTFISQFDVAELKEVLSRNGLRFEEVIIR